jgi:hypothetical protein
VDATVRQAVAIALAPIAQLAERTAYTRRELRTGARLEVRVLLGVLCFLSRSSVDQSTVVRRRGSRVQVAPGQPYQGTVISDQ